MASMPSELRGGVGADRAYDILYYRYLEQLNQDEVAFQLGLSIRQLRREQNNAIELLADLLWRKVDSNRLSSETHQEGRPAKAAPLAAIDEEVARLRHEAPAQPSEIQTELAMAVADAHVVAQHHRVSVQLPTLPAQTLRVPMPPFVLRQALLVVITSMVVCTHDDALSISVSTTESQIELVFLLRKKGGRIARDIDFETALHTASRLLAPFDGRVWGDSDIGAVHLALPPLGSIPVLVIDDNPDARQLFQRYTAESRFRIIPIEEPEQAFTLAQERDFAGVVMDIMMPTVDGWDLLARWRQHPVTHHIPVAVCTILPQKELAHLLGARLFIQKPVDQKSFLQALEDLTA